MENLGFFKTNHLDSTNVIANFLPMDSERFWSLDTVQMHSE